jgi:hypothetical protein
MQVLKVGILYFAIVFGVGFVLGPIRILWLLPRVGARWAELLEAPIMLGVIVAAARWVVLRLALPPSTSTRLGAGFIALGLMLAAEFTVALWFRGLSLHEYFANREPVAGTVYYVLLGVFAIMPFLVARR